MELYVAVDKMAPINRCGCGAKTELLGQGIPSRSSPLAASTSSLVGDDRIALTDRPRRRKRTSLHFNLVVKAEKRQPWSPRSMARRERAEERERRDFVLGAQRLFAVKESVGVALARSLERSRNYKWRFMSAAAAAGLSWTLCSSAVASPITIEGPGQMLTSPISENLRAHVETQLRRELQAQIRVQKDWLDEIGQPLGQWSIDERVRQSLEAKSRARLDESGKAVSKLEMLESEVVPIFKPPLVASSKEKVGNGVVGALSKEKAGVATGVVGALSKEKAGVATASSSSTPEAAKENKAGSQTQTQSVGVEPKESLIVKTIPPGVSELVAVAAIPLGPVVSAASRTVGSAASMAAMQATGTAVVPGVSLFSRILMHFGGGGVAGAMGATLVYPLDTIKTRMQAQSDDEGDETHYKDEWDCLRRVVAKEGVGSLYSGLVPQLIGIAPEKAMKLTVNEVLMEMLECQMPGVGAWALELIAGGGGGFSQVVFTNPMEIVKVRLQTQAKDVKQKNSWDVIKELGVKGLYNGSAMTMARDIPSSAMFFAIYTLIRQVHPDQSFVAGFMAAIPATILVTPFDVVKTRLQMERAEGEVPYENGYACFVTIMEKEGLGALFKGSVARVLKTSPQFGITLMLYNILCGGS